MQQIDKIVETWKSEVLSAFCLNGCDHICCSTNFDLTEEQVRLIFGLTEGPIEIPSPYKVPGFTKKNGIYRTNFKSEKGYCPQNVEDRCQIYEHPSRPKTCADFPMFVRHEKKELMFAYVCPFVDLEHAADVYSAAIELGYKVVNLWDEEITKEKIEDFKRKKEMMKRIFERLAGQTY